MSVEQKRMGRPSQGRSRKIQVNFTPELFAWIEKKADQERKSMSEIIFAFAEEAHEREGKQHEQCDHSR